MTRRKRKPTGETGHVQVSRATGVPGFVAVPFPTTKEDVERYLAESFVQAAAQDDGFFPFSVSGAPEQNPTDDFDFTLQTSNGPKYLELMEVQLRDVVQTGGPSQTSSYMMDAVARLIVERILAKSRRYQGATSHGIILLTYITHWQFTPMDPVIWLLWYWLLNERPVFEQVYYMSFDSSDSVSVSLLYPIPEDVMKGFDPAMFQGKRAFILNPHSWQQHNE